MGTVYAFPYRTVAEVSLSRLVKNLVSLRSFCGREVIPVVKADAYGHGLFPVSRALVAHGCIEMLAVATLDEGLEIRKRFPDVDVLVLSGFFPHQIEAYRRYRITPVIHSLAHLRTLCGEPKTPLFHLEIDTGMNRLGIKESEFSEMFRLLEKIEGKCAGLATHFAESEVASSNFTDEQLARFEHIYREMCDRKMLATDARIHVANSAGVLRKKWGPTNAVRTGLSLYGVTPNPNGDECFRLWPVLEWKTRILCFKDISKGESVGYNRQYVAKRKERLAILPIGYADGYPRLSHYGSVLIQGKRAPVRGIISMDLMSVDVSHLSGLKEGHPVVLIGRHGKEEISAWELARHAKTIPYEILCGLSSRVTRLYFE